MLKYLFDPNIQFLDTSGAINVGGHLEVYQAYTDDAATTYADISGNAMNPQKIPLDSNGRATVAVDDGKSYRLEVYAEGGLLLWTVQPYMPSGTIVNLPVIVDGTENEIDVSESLSASEKTFTVSLSESVKKSIGDLDKSLSDETKARKEADKLINDSISAIGDALSTETTERKEADAELAKAIAGKQSPLKDGDNIHIDGEKKVNVVNRKTLQVKNPLTAEKLDSALVLGIRDGAFTTADDIASEAEARKAADDTLESSMAGKQDGPFTFDSSSSTNSDVMAAIASGRTIVSGSGSSFSTWQGSIAGGVANLFRVFGTDVFCYYYSFGQWAFQRYSLATTMDYSKVAYPTSTQVPGDILFAMGGFNVCGYTDNAGALRLCVVPTDGKDHSIYANGGGYRCDAETGANVSTSFTAGSPYLRLYLVDTGYWDSDTSSLTPTNWTVHEAEIYAMQGSSVADSSILYRIITDQTIGGANG